jgi:hypothetical protein
MVELAIEPQLLKAVKEEIEKFMPDSCVREIVEGLLLTWVAERRVAKMNPKSL